jgi:hypothetical protein
VSELIDFLNRYRTRAGLKPAADEVAQTLVFDDLYAIDFHQAARDSAIMSTALFSVSSGADSLRKLKFAMNAGLALSSRLQGTVALNDTHDTVIFFDSLRLSGANDREAFEDIDRFANEIAALHAALYKNPAFVPPAGQSREFSNWRR